MARLSPTSFILLLCATHFSSCNTDIYGEREQPELKLFHHSCALKKDEGHCKALLDRFYFDVETKQCERFGYGGCGGNANNFETVEECEETCVVKPDKSPCDLPEEVGPCRGIIIRYFFNAKSQRCESFFYGGCLGNANNFRSKAECNAKCLKQGPERSREMAGNTNPEAGSKPRTQAFISLENPREGLAQGGSPPDHCLSPIEKGTCRQSIKRYAYSPTSKRCHSFRYGGCSGNGNNFASRRECMKTCVRGMYNHNQRATQNTTILEIIFESA